MSRQNFTKAIKVSCIKRATIGGVVYCEQCGALAKRFEIDHIRADGLLGKPTLENAKLLCLPCHDHKTAVDVPAIARAKRREAKHIGAVIPKQKIANRGFAKSEKPEPRFTKTRLEPLKLYRDA